MVAIMTAPMANNNDNNIERTNQLLHLYNFECFNYYKQVFLLQTVYDANELVIFKHYC